MISDQIGQRLRDRSIRGESLSAEERAILDAWYARHDAEEQQLFAAARLKRETSLHERIQDTIARMTILTRKMEESLAESKQLQDELTAICRQSVEEEVAGIRQAYPLMDAVARQEGWDDPEMDSYNPLRSAEGNQRDKV
jgi:hypothetical protein